MSQSSQSLMDDCICGIVYGCIMELGLLLRSDVSRILLVIHPECGVCFERASRGCSQEIWTPVGVYFEDVSQNPLKCSEHPRLVKIGVISKSLLNKRKRKMYSGYSIYFWR